MALNAGVPAPPPRSYPSNALRKRHQLVGPPNLDRGSFVVLTLGEVPDGYITMIPQYSLSVCRHIDFRWIVLFGVRWC